MGLSAFGVRKPVAANLVMFTLIGMGLVFGLQLRREFFPEVRPKQVVVVAPYPGAPPDEIEETLARKIEDRVIELDDVEEVSTTITEGLATISIEYTEGVDIDIALDEVKREIDALEDLPEDAERIRVDKFEPNLPTISLSLTLPADERTTKRVIRQMRDDLRSLPRMGDVEVSGTKRDEIAVEVSPDVMVEHRLSLPEIAQRVGAAMAELPAGPVRAPTSHVSVRTVGAEERADAVRDIIIKADGAGQALRVRDIAEVTDGFVDVDFATRVNGKPCVSLTAYTVSDEDAIDLANMVKAYAAGRSRTPIEEAGIKGSSRAEGSSAWEAYELGLSRPKIDAEHMVLHTDLARFIQQRLDLLLRNATWGGALVFMTLVLLLNWRVAFWVGMGLAVSVLGTLALMYWIDITLNLLTMFGLIVVLGLLVDDAIVVAENIVARREKGEPALVAAVNGTRQVLWPVVTTVITTICAFMPLMLIQGQIGDLLGALPIVVACALAVSLIEALLILPSHIGHSLERSDRRRERATAAGRPPRKAIVTALRERIFHGWIESGYEHLLRVALRYRYLAAAIAITSLLLSLALPAGGKLPFTFSPSSDSETITANVTMPIGTPLSVTDRIVARLEAVAQAQPEVSSVFGLVGVSVSPDGGDETSSTHLGQLFIELHPAEERTRTSDEVIATMREELGVLPGIKSLRFAGIQGGPSGLPIEYAVSAEDPDRIGAVTGEIKTMLREYEGVFDISDDSDAGQRELRIRLRDGARELGFQTADVAMQIRGAVFGIEAHTFAEDQEDVDVRVMADRHTRRSLGALERIHIFTPDGRPVPLVEVAEVEESRTYATLRRLDRQRSVTVSADVDQVAINPEEVLSDMVPRIADLRERYPDVTITPRGREEEVRESLASLPIGMMTAAGIIYVILAWLFSSYTQPLLVMMAIPFAIIGMIWGHIIMGFNLTVLSLIGFVALAGIVVNDSLIFMEFYNMRRRAGDSAPIAAFATGKVRFRPILLTTVTTILGLSPLMLEQSFQARFLIPMAITISFGLASATVLVLLFLPCMLVMSSDIRRVLSFLWTGRLPQQLEHPIQGEHAVVLSDAAAAAIAGEPSMTDGDSDVAAESAVASAKG
jgi:HAE1 family hydrophobic/amphiphilic exporter-1